MLSAGVKRELTWIIGAVWGLMFFAWFTDWWLQSLFFFIFVYIARHLWSMHRFEKWMEGSTHRIFPPASGLWSELTYQVSKKQRALEKHADLYLYKSEQFKAASMLIPNAIVSLDQHNDVEWFNQPSKKILGLRHQDIGRKVEGIIRQPEFLKYFRQGNFDAPLIIHALRGSRRTYKVQIIPYFETHKLVVASDITELYQLAQIRRDFIANASHELRTPLTVLKGYLELMSDMPGERNPQWDLPLEHMTTQAVRMQAIIEDLLTLSTMEADSINAESEPVDVPEILKQLAIEARQLGSDEHKIVFEIDTHLWLKGYAEPLKSVFMNLVANAVRYSPEGGEIKARWYQDKDGVHFAVSDQGLGIAQEHIPRLTERFYRVDKDRSRGTGGTGLGLAIVKHVLEKHQAHLHIDSLLGKGSTFRCDFPAKIALKAKK
ncbi:phosphate regulon sensor histidine kinase PhoR [Thiomicrorhabdus sp.]|uniref:phosphate regulon sensor histidine kinase PhoR n=1 Tax=Thiomicrorhabdus sp. TaxID=2039724 RepID=UPI0037489245